MRILIIDDEELIREVIKEYAINEGYEVLEACNGIKALEIIKNVTFRQLLYLQEMKNMINSLVSI